MNDYPVWWDTTITVFNRFEDNQTNVISWYKTVIDGCFWKHIRDKISVGETVLETDKILCRIRKDERYKNRYDWERIPNDEMQNYFTLTQGDIIVKGSVDDEIDEYTEGQRSNDIVEKYKKYQGCFEIESCSDNTGVGRCNEHYIAEGL